jgi:galactokinase
MESGGMDQTCSVMADHGKALYVSFQPALQATPVYLPPELTFIVTNSMVVSDKQLTAPTHYNLRVCETRMGAVLLSRALGLNECLTYRQVHDEYARTNGIPPDQDVLESIPILQELLHVVDLKLAKEPYTLEKLGEVLGMKVHLPHNVSLF